jgi:hypothetical protein
MWPSSLRVKIAECERNIVGKIGGELADGYLHAER